MILSSSIALIEIAEHAIEALEEVFLMLIFFPFVCVTPVLQEKERVCVLCCTDSP